MYYEDFSKYGNTEGAVVYGVGWLDVAQPFNIGDTDISIVNKLGAILNIQRINLMRGIHQCTICRNKEDIYSVGYNRLLGISEIWVPNEARTKIYAMPSLVIHYITEHYYLLPEEVLEAIKLFDLNSGWSGEEAYKEYVKIKYGV